MIYFKHKIKTSISLNALVKMMIGFDYGIGTIRHENRYPVFKNNKDVIFNIRSQSWYEKGVKVFIINNDCYGYSAYYIGRNLTSSYLNNVLQKFEKLENFI